MSDNIVNATITEARAKPDKKHILTRLSDWRTRVHALYGTVQSSLGDAYTYDRSGKHVSSEELVQRAGIKPQEVPELDILRIEQAGKLVATFQPRGLWIIGANGRVDMTIFQRLSGRHLYMLIDHSLPLSSAADWRIVRPSDRLEQPPFRPERLPELLA